LGISKRGTRVKLLIGSPQEALLCAKAKRQLQMFSVAKVKRQLQMFSVAKAKRQLQMFSVAKAKRQLQSAQPERKSTTRFDDDPDKDISYYLNKK